MTTNDCDLADNSFEENDDEFYDNDYVISKEDLLSEKNDRAEDVRASSRGKKVRKPFMNCFGNINFIVHYVHEWHLFHTFVEKS